MNTTKIKTKTEIERMLGALLIRDWVLDGPGPARYGWASVQTCRYRWEGYTLLEIVTRLEETELARTARVQS